MNVTAAIHMHARLRPRAPAVITPSRALTFAQLDAAIWRAAARFKAEGLAAGQVVAVDIADSVKHLIVALALGRIGVAHLANFHGHDAAVLAPLMARVNAVRTISEAEVQDDEVLFGPAQLTLDSIGVMAAEMRQHASMPWLYVALSGTTGRPKIISITHRMSLQRGRRVAAGVPVLASDRHMPLSELAFFSSTERAIGALNVGGCVVLADGLDLGRKLEFIRRNRVTRISCAAVHLHWLWKLGEKQKEMLLPQLRVLEVLGSTVTEQLRRRVKEKVSRNLYVNYAMTESGTVTVAPPEMEMPETVGTALPGVRLQIVDAADQPLPHGEVGIIRIRAPGAIDRYFDDAEATAKAFRGGWFYPGDLGVLTGDEQLIFKGRADDMMIFDGINIYPAEIEAALAAHEAVGEAAAFPLKSEIHQDVPVAAVTLRAPVPEAELLAFCRARLGSRAPQKIIVVDEFPRNPAGKILKRELADLLKRKLAAGSDAGKPAAVVAPRSHRRA